MAGDYSFTDRDLTDNRYFDYALRGERQMPQQGARTPQESNRRQCRVTAPQIAAEQDKTPRGACNRRTRAQYRAQKGEKLSHT